MNLYITADKVGAASGGGKVTFHESEALKGLGPCTVLGRDDFEGAAGAEPWKWDECAAFGVRSAGRSFGLAHFYAGTFTETVAELKRQGTKVTYTAAAHDVAASRREHEKLGVPFDYPHLTDPELWKRYLGGYLAADLIICPSKHSAAVMRGFGARNKIDIIPHGVDLPRGVASLPGRFTIGYLGAVGPDKGLRYLIEAWGRLAYKDATLRIAGAQSQSDFVIRMVQVWGGNGIFDLVGWVENVSDFYNSLTCYVQPSVTEGYGIEVLEALAHGRPVLCSTGAGAADAVDESCRFPPADAEALAAQIDGARDTVFGQMPWMTCREAAEMYTWPKIRALYQQVWRELL